MTANPWHLPHARHPMRSTPQAARANMGSSVNSPASSASTARTSRLRQRSTALGVALRVNNVAANANRMASWSSGTRWALAGCDNCAPGYDDCDCAQFDRVGKMTVNLKAAVIDHKLRRGHPEWAPVSTCDYIRVSFGSARLSFQLAFTFSVSASATPPAPVDKGGGRGPSQPHGSGCRPPFTQVRPVHGVTTAWVAADVTLYPERQAAP